MKDKINLLNILSDKILEDLNLFANESLKNNEEETNKKFYDLIQRVIVESIHNKKDKIIYK